MMRIHQSTRVLMNRWWTWPLSVIIETGVGIKTGVDATGKVKTSIEKDCD